MKSSRIVYGIAAVYGFLTLPPLYFLLARIGKDAPPPVSHPEFYFGFVGLALLWQFFFVLIAKNPARYRPIMLIAIFEKFIYTVPAVILYQFGQLHVNGMWPALIDPLFGILFIWAYLWTRPARHSDSSSAWKNA